MWGRKDELSPSNEPVSHEPAAPAPVTAAPPAPRPAPAAASNPSGNRQQAQIGKSLKLKGEITGSEDLLIDGEVEGTVELRENSLTVGPNGNIRAHVRARSITVLGRLQGNVEAGERIEIRKTGSLEGDLVTPRIVIEDGAVFRGSIDILKEGHSSGASEKKPSTTAPGRQASSPSLEADTKPTTAAATAPKSS
jgi:cytoskeletal protein CcmA (bactofilin family)